MSNLSLRLSSPEATDPKALNPVLEARRQKLRRVVAWTVGGALLLTCAGLVRIAMRSHEDSQAPKVAAAVPTAAGVVPAEAAVALVATAPVSASPSAVAAAPTLAKAAASSTKAARVRKRFVKVTRSATTPQKR